MHALGYQLLQPEKWYGWYVKGNMVDASGLSLHAFQFPRFLHFIVPSFAMTGIFMMLYAWYFNNRKDIDKGYLEWVGKTGGNMAFGFTSLQAAVGFWWLLSVPGDLAFMTNPFFSGRGGIGHLPSGAPLCRPERPREIRNPQRPRRLLTIFGMSYTREALRDAVLLAVSAIPFFR